MHLMHSPLTPLHIPYSQAVTQNLCNTREKCTAEKSLSLSHKYGGMVLHHKFLKL